MSNGPPTEDRTVSTFLDYIALACIFGFVEAVMSGRPLSIGVGVLVAALIFHVIGIKWPQIKERTGKRFTAWLDRIANNNRYRRGVIVLLLSCLVVPGLVYVHSLRSDLDAYVMPRHFTDEQSDALREYLAHHENHAVTVKVNPVDKEALEYASQLFNALRRTEWDVTFSPSNGEAVTLNDGLSISVQGVNAGPPDRKHDPQPLLQDALVAAHIEVNGGGGVGAGDYKLFILVGHRPLVVGDREPTLYKIGRWIESLGQ